jgi:SSS family solute:Na+ symporter
MGRWCTMIGVFISIGTAYLVMLFSSIMVYAQILFGFFIAPLFGVVILGMLWKRATSAGGFWGLLAGTLSSIGMWTWVQLDPGALRIVALSPHAKELAENSYRAIWTLLISVLVTVTVSLCTTPRAEADLKNLVYGLTPVPSEGHFHWYQRPAFWAAVVGIGMVVVNVIFW